MTKENYRTRHIAHLLRFLIPSDASVLEVREDEFHSLKLDPPGAPFDYIYLSGQLEYLHDIEGTLRDCYRLLKEGEGRIRKSKSFGRSGGEPFRSLSGSCKPSNDSQWFNSQRYRFFFAHQNKGCCAII